MPMTHTDAFDAFQRRAHFAALDGLRFVAIAGVLFLHSPLSPQAAEVAILFGRGFLGVDLFFVISGFLITTLLLREHQRTGRISIRDFYWRRALRILPLYLLVVTALGAYYVLINPQPGASALWLAYYLFLANLLTEHIPMLDPTWSLSVEEQYYLVWPLILLVVPRRWLPWGIAVFVLGYALAIAAGVDRFSWQAGPLLLRLSALPYPAILLGSGLALMLHAPRGFAILWALLGARWTCVGLAALLVLEMALLPETLLGLPLLLVHLTLTAWLGSLVIREDTPLMGLLRWRPLVRIGMVSYGIYLLHLIANHIAGVVIWRMLGDPASYLAAYLPLSWGLSWLMAEISFRFYERPFLALRHKPLGQDSGPGPRPA